jgi:type II secretory pathway component PulM
MATPAFLAPAKTRFGELAATMSPRDRRLFVGLVVFLCGSVLAGAWWYLERSVASLDSRIIDREDKLDILDEMVAEFQAASETAGRIEEKLTEYAGQDLSAFIEATAKTTGIQQNLKGVREKGTSTEGSLERREYTVELDRVSLQQVTDFLYAIETSGYPLKIANAKFKTLTWGGQKVLQATFEVNAYSLPEAVAPSGAASAPAAEKEPTP